MSKSGAPKAGGLRVTVAQAAPPPVAAPRRAAPVVSARPFRGYYRRNIDSVFFQPCGDPRYYELVGVREALNLLRERYRFTAIYPGRPMFAALRGDFIDDTVRVPATTPGSAPSTRVVKRFYMSRYDTLRARTDGDCRGNSSSGGR